MWANRFGRSTEKQGGKNHRRACEIKNVTVRAWESFSLGNDFSHVHDDSKRP